jgi:ribonuclease E
VTGADAPDVDPGSIATPGDAPVAAVDAVAEPFAPEPDGDLGRREWAARDNGDATPRDNDATGLDADDPERAPPAPPPETLGGEGPDESADEAAEDADGGRERRSLSGYLRHYKIQEVIRRRQVMLIQVVKEERGTKGAALTTFISLAGRFSVLMPNSPRGGGVSRKITSVSDRKRLREAIDEVGLPDGMSLIVRTAGAQRPKPEIRRDCEYLLRLWDSIRERTLASTAPALIYEEADLIKRSIRDVFSRDVEEVLIEGDAAFQEAHEFMRMLMPQNARRIQAYRDGGVPLFARFQVEAQLDAMHSPVVQLKSGGYIVINQTEALVAIDVNSGRATRERHIEDTAFRTNCEASEEIARQLRLRDLAGLIVIDFIDMESSRNDAVVERKLKDALRHDRARIQVGRISHFGLLEMSRQRLRPSLAETTFVTCPHCQGLGQVRSIENAALTVLRAIEEEGGKRRAAEITVHVSPVVALYLLNRKRQRLADIEDRFGMAVLFEPDTTLNGAALRIDRLRPAEPMRTTAEMPAALRMDYAPEPEAMAEAPVRLPPRRRRWRRRRECRGPGRRGRWRRRRDTGEDRPWRLGGPLGDAGAGCRARRPGAWTGTRAQPGADATPRSATRGGGAGLS